MSLELSSQASGKHVMYGSQLTVSNHLRRALAALHVPPMRSHDIDCALVLDQIPVFCTFADFCQALVANSDRP